MQRNRAATQAVKCIENGRKFNGKIRFGLVADEFAFIERSCVSISNARCSCATKSFIYAHATPERKDECIAATITSAMNLNYLFYLQPSSSLSMISKKLPSTTFDFAASICFVSFARSHVDMLRAHFQSHDLRRLMLMVVVVVVHQTNSQINTNGRKSGGKSHQSLCM